MSHIMALPPFFMYLLGTVVVFTYYTMAQTLTTISCYFLNVERI